MPVRIHRTRSTDQDFNRFLGILLRGAREDVDLRLKDVHERTGMGIEFLFRMENGKSRPTIMELMQLSLVYEVPVMEFLEHLWPLVEVTD